MSDTTPGPMFFVRAAATWTADDGAPKSDRLGSTRVATTRLGRMAAHVVAALPTLADLRRTRPTWIIASAMGPLDAIVSELRAPGTSVRPEALCADGPANELAARLGGLMPFVPVGAGPRTVAMALIEAAAWLASGREDVVLVVAEAETPAALHPADRFEPLAVALHLAADPGRSDLAVLAGPDAVRVTPTRATGPHAGSPAWPALRIAQAALAGEVATVSLDPADGPPGAGVAVPPAWVAQIKPVDSPPA
ncbi:MAG: beta-ketoacyl synthase chain length factor [Myxococcota bacterium]